MGKGSRRDHAAIPRDSQLRNIKLFAIKGIILIALIFVVIFLFKFPVDYLDLKSFSINQATQIINKADALKLAALAGLFFAIYYRERIDRISHERPDYLKGALYATGGIVSVAAYFGLRYYANLHAVTSGSQFWVIFGASIIVLLAALSSFTLSVFSLPYLLRFWQAFSMQLLFTLGITAASYVLLAYFQTLWPYLSVSISIFLLFMFMPFFPTFLEFSESAPILDVNGFVVSIGAPCSGIESLFLFAAFSIGIYALDHKRIKKRFWLISLAGLIGIYFVNLVRLFLLILTGIYIDPDFAVGLFHTNVGWLLFVAYFFGYYYLIRRYIYLS